MERVWYQVYVLGDGENPKKEEYFRVKYIYMCRNKFLMYWPTPNS